MEMGGLGQEVTQGVAAAMKKRPPPFEEGTLLEKGKDPKLHYPQSLMEIETSLKHSKETVSYTSWPDQMNFDQKERRYPGCYHS